MRIGAATGEGAGADVGAVRIGAATGEGAGADVGAVRIGAATGEGAGADVGAVRIGAATGEGAGADVGAVRIGAATGEGAGAEVGAVRIGAATGEGAGAEVGAVRIGAATGEGAGADGAGRAPAACVGSVPAGAATRVLNPGRDGTRGNLEPSSPVDRTGAPAGRAGALFLMEAREMRGSVSRRGGSPEGGRTGAPAPTTAAIPVLRREGAGTGGVTGKGRSISKNPSFQPITSGSRSGASLPPTTVPTNSPRR